ncbi:DUF1259 domain-containing protein [Streptomyces chiangmaiensis]|uniref:DUF1259 domain-containing protein n=1 Tax=Streptomyces chiangmaiensis TaxID=766497 RepID=A0ABU7FCJ3_9ACTN|nr:DUF1259 domain-containing protein [Streptomyces chiangmaiensis]MED7821892.1 DUF1259 domain-containing protein [Streptomyces chiangmaiensis]
MMADDRQQDPGPRAVTPRRHVLAAAALTPMLAVTAPACAQSTGVTQDKHHEPVVPVRTALSDWKGVADALGRPGDMKRGLMYHTGLPRLDLRLVSHGVVVKPALALGSHVSFVRYTDGGTLLMGDVVVTENEMQPFLDVLQERGIEQTAIHKHLLSQSPDIWWIHVHAHSDDPVAVARGLRAAFDRTGTPPPARPLLSPPRPVDLDTAGIDAALGVKGSTDEGIYKNTFVRRETITEGHMVLPPGLGSTTAFNFQPLGGGRAALSGDCAMIADEVQPVLTALRRAGAELVEVHNHGLKDEPRLFFVHFWAVGDAVEIARGLRAAVNATNVVPVPGAVG